MTYTPIQNSEIHQQHALSAERLFSTVLNAATEGRHVSSSPEKFGIGSLNIDQIEPMAWAEGAQWPDRQELLGVLALGSPLVLLGIVAVQGGKRDGQRVVHDERLTVVHMGSDGRAPRRIKDIDMFGAELEIGCDDIGEVRGAEAASLRHVRLAMNAGVLAVVDLKTTNGTTLYTRDPRRSGIASLGLVYQLKPGETRPELPAVSWVV